MNALSKISGMIDAINNRVGKAVSWLMVIMVLNVFLVVVLRYVFSIGFIWMQELYVWTHAAIFMLGASYALLHDEHVRIDLIYRTASARYKAWVNLLGSIMFALPLLGLLLLKSWPQVVRSFNTMEKSAEAGGLPGLFILKAVIPLFCILLGLQILSLMLRSIISLMTPKKNIDFISQTQNETAANHTTTILKEEKQVS